MINYALKNNRAPAGLSGGRSAVMSGKLFVDKGRQLLRFEYKGNDERYDDGGCKSEQIGRNHSEDLSCRGKGNDEGEQYAYCGNRKQEPVMENALIKQLGRPR